MKTKLLKKLRKRFSIVYYPNGYLVYCLGTTIYRHETYGCVSLLYNGDRKNYSLGEYTLKQAVGEAKREILKYARENYSRKATQVNKIRYKGIKIWYNV